MIENLDIIELGGHVHCVSEETKTKIGLKSKELWENKDYREKQYLSHIGKMPDNTGRQVSEYTKEKIKLATMGRIPWNKGLKHCFSEETIDTIGEKAKERYKDENYRRQHLEDLHRGSLIAGKNREKKVRCIETDSIYDSVKKASLDTNIQRVNITKVCRGERVTAGGYHWEYI